MGDNWSQVQSSMMKDSRELRRVVQLLYVKFAHSVSTISTHKSQSELCRRHYKYGSRGVVNNWLTWYWLQFTTTISYAWRPGVTRSMQSWMFRIHSFKLSGSSALKRYVSIDDVTFRKELLGTDSSKQFGSASSTVCTIPPFKHSRNAGSGS